MLEKRFEGSMAGLVAQAGGSAAWLVNLIAAAFPGFRDCATYK